MNLFQRARKTSTVSYIIATAGAALLSALVRFASTLVPYSLSLVTAVLELTAMGLFVIAYLSSWALLCVGAFRPGNQFTLRGERSHRIVNVVLALCVLGMIHVVLALGVATARS